MACLCHKCPTQKAVICYRQEYRIEHKFNELLHKITALVPVFLQDDDRVKALIRLLLLSLKFVSTIEDQARKGLEKTGGKLKELYPGNPGRATDKPTTKMILEAFKNINLVIMTIEGKTIIKINQLKPIQIQLIQLLNINPEVYTDIENLSFSDSHLGET